MCWLGWSDRTRLGSVDRELSQSPRGGGLCSESPTSSSSETLRLERGQAFVGSEGKATGTKKNHKLYLFSESPVRTPEYGY